MNYLLIIPALPLLFIATFYVLLWLIDLVTYPQAIKELKAINMPNTDAIVASIERARKADRKARIYDASAPVVAAIALLFARWEADKLPRFFKKWDNEVNLNGDSFPWINPKDDNGNWTHVGTAQPIPTGDTMLYWDADVGDNVERPTKELAYWVDGKHHPRSYWARYVWIGWRNRASQVSLDCGIRTRKADVMRMFGSTDISARKEGAFLMQHGDDYHYKSVRKVGGFALIRSLGYKLGMVKQEVDGVGKCAAVYIPWSVKRWKGDQTSILEGGQHGTE